MVDDFGHTRPHVHGAHPNIPVERVRHYMELVIHHARCRHVERGNVDDDIRLAHCPLRRRHRGLRQRVWPGAAWRPRLNPMHQGLPFRDAERPVVLPNAHMGVRMPRRHPAGADHLADHRREAPHHRVAAHRPRPDAAGAVTFHAVGLQERRDGVAVGDGGVVRFLAWEVHQAAYRRCPGDGRRGIGQHRFQGVTQIVMLRLGLLPFVAQPVVGGAAIDDAPIARVDDDDLRGALKPQGLPHQLRLIDQDGIGDGPLVGLLGDGFAGVLQVGVNHQELHTTRGVRIADGAVIHQRVAHDGAAVALHDEHDCRGIGVIVELVRGAAMIQEREVIDPRGLGA